MESKALKHFKRNVGVCNHLLITNLVGLDGIIYQNITKRDGFHTVWNPKDIKSSVDRARIYDLKSTVIWLCTFLDEYLMSLNREPRLLNEEISNKFDDAGGVKERLDIISNFVFNNKKPITYYMVRYLIGFRNKLIHSNVKENLLNDVNKELLTCKTLTQETYSGLIIDDLIKDYENNQFKITFKEVASLVKATIDFIYIVDEDIINNIEVERIVKEILIEFNKTNKDSFEKIEKSVRLKKFKMLLSTEGFNFITEGNDEILNEVLNITFSSHN